MKNSFLIIISVLIPLNCFAAWFKLFSITNADLFIDTKSISRDQNKIFFSQLVNYKKKQPNGMLSLEVYSEVNCNNLSIREFNFKAYTKSMAMGENFLEKKKKKKLENSGKRFERLFCQRNSL